MICDWISTFPGIKRLWQILKNKMALSFHAVSLIKHLFREKKNNSKPPGPLLNVFPWNHVMLDGLPCDAGAPFYYYIKKITSSLSFGEKKKVFSIVYQNTFPGTLPSWAEYRHCHKLDPTLTDIQSLQDTSSRTFKKQIQKQQTNIQSDSYFYCALLAVNRCAGVKQSGTGDTYGLLFGSTALPIFAQAAQETCTPCVHPDRPEEGCCCRLPARGGEIHRPQRERGQRWWGEDG